MNSRLQAILAAVFLFLCGATTGGALALWFGAHAFAKMLQSGPQEAAIADFAVHHVEADLARELALDAPTRSAVREELLRSALEIKRVRSEGVHHMALAFQAAGARLAALLPPEKRPRFYEISQKRLHQFGFDTFAPRNHGLDPAGPPPPP